MTHARTFLLAALRRGIDGAEVTNNELDAAIAEPADLRGAERKAWHGMGHGMAWHGMSYWADEDDIRAKDPAYAPSRRRQPAVLIAGLENEKVG